MIEPLTILQKLGYTFGILIPTAMIVAMFVAPSLKYENEKRIWWWIDTIIDVITMVLITFFFCVVPLACIASALWMIWFGDKP